ncbi:bifunctional metallophosphatase/5'-nucleotidase [Haloarchaeobius amylolyticus]|uniref:bifunctional metallophosphatase/5'-nucleotidase n=1 Tax=Haloarchaeobius amylolyticus TaxID=1198296 RepID=UPI00226E7718|nr:5'-nucleotidase C-terminal domain-containing protein [Haloarchaeobius amylolyticus]
MSLRILHYADVERATDEPRRLGRLVGLVESLRDEETLVVGAGDNLAPGVLSLVTEGRQALDFYEAVQPDAETFGNHDFDHGPAATRDVVRDSPMPWVCANVCEGEAAADDASPDDLFASEQGTVSWLVAEPGDHRVGIVGVTTPETPEMNPEAEPLAFRDPVEMAADAVAAVRERDVDHVVVLSHMGSGDDDLAEALDVDCILGGHAHTERIETIEGTLVVRPGGTAGGLAEVVFDDRPTAYRYPLRDAPVHEGVVEALEARRREAGLADVVDTVEDPIPVTRTATKQGESRVGNLVTDAYRWVADADVAVHSTGGLRSGDALAGEVTAADLVGLCPFENDLVRLEVTGEQLRRTVANLGLVQYDPADVPAHYFGHVSGLDIVWDDERRQPRSIAVGGDPVGDDATYTLATSNYYVESSHLFDAFAPEDVTDSLGPQYEAIVEYCRECGIEATLDGRIERPLLDGQTVVSRQD